MNATSVSLYVYYRIIPDRAAQAQRAIAAVLRAVEQQTGVVGRLSRRQDDPSMWMEVYESVRDAARFEATLDHLIEAQRFATFLAPGSKRTTERFVA